MASGVIKKNVVLQYVEEDISVSFTAGTIGTRGFQKRLNTQAPSDKRLIGSTITYVADSSSIIPVLLAAGSDLYLNCYRATSEAVLDDSVRVRFTFTD